jgi:hypothetical protein
MRPGQSLDLCDRRCRLPVFLECFAPRLAGFPPSRADRASERRLRQQIPRGRLPNSGTSVRRRRMSSISSYDRVALAAALARIPARSIERYRNAVVHGARISACLQNLRSRTLAEAHKKPRLSILAWLSTRLFPFGKMSHSALRNAEFGCESISAQITPSATTPLQCPRRTSCGP